MTLGFSIKWNDKTKTNFIEKIWAGFIINEIFVKYIRENYNWSHFYNFAKFFDKEEFKPKLHTIREDKHNRWREGMDIHFVINNRTKKRFQFAPKIKCVSTQHILIYNNSGQEIVYINDRGLRQSEKKELAYNDGFDSVEQFFNWFSTDFEGKIIHWSNLRY